MPTPEYYALFGGGPEEQVETDQFGNPLVPDAAPPVPVQPAPPEQVIDGAPAVLEQPAPEIPQADVVTGADAAVQPEEAQALEAKQAGERQALAQAAQERQARTPVNAVTRRGGSFDVNTQATQHNARIRGQGLTDARAAGAQAIDASTEADRAINQARAEQTAEMAEVDRQNIAELTALQAEQHEAAQTRMAEIDSAIQEAAQHRVKPGRLWNTDTGTSLAGAFAAFTGGFLTPVLGKNDIQGIIERGIARDVDAQKEEGAALDKLVSDLAAQDARKTKLSDKLVGNRQAQIMARRAALIQEFDSHLMTLNDPKIRAQGDKLIAEQRILLEKERIGLEESEYARAEKIVERKTRELMQKRQIAAASAARRAASKAKELDHARKMALMNKQGTFSAKSGLIGANGKPVVITSEKYQREVSAATHASNSATNMIDALLENGNLSRFVNPTGGDKLLLKQFGAHLAVAANGGTGGGQFTDQDALRELEKYGLKEVNGVVRLTGSASDLAKALKRGKAEIHRQMNSHLNSVPGLSDQAPAWKAVRDEEFQKSIAMDFKGEVEAPLSSEEFGNAEKRPDAALAEGLDRLAQLEGNAATEQGHYTRYVDEVGKRRAAQDTPELKRKALKFYRETGDTRVLTKDEQDYYAVHGFRPMESGQVKSGSASLGDQTRKDISNVKAGAKKARKLLYGF